MNRCAGILCPVFSIPANQGIGDFGQKTIKMIDIIADAGYKIWQILPLQMTGSTHSPYQTYSSFAGDPIYINLDRLCEMGLLKQSSIVNCNKFSNFIEYQTVRDFKESYFKKAFRVFKKEFNSFKEEYEAFENSAFWLEDWAAYSLFKSFYDGAPWYEWEDEYRDWPENKDIDLSDYADDLFYIKFLQFIFHKQLDEIQMYAHARNLKIMGDMPFYVDLDSADVWCNKDSFLLDENGDPEYIAGCPPDYFSETGQRWGMPIYDFETQEKEGFTFWCSRMKWMQKCYDMVRIDHFRAFDTYWKIPASCPTAIEGEWILGPAKKLLDAILKACPGIVLVAEDLGLIRPEVIELEEHYNIPGMDVLLFRMETKQLKKKAKQNSVVYTGTHDNATLNEDYHTFDSNKRISLRRYFKKLGYNSRNFNDMVCQYALDCDADTVILPIWDICGYKEEARINTPGTVSNKNWTWKLKDFKVFPKEIKKTKEWIEKSNR